MTIEEIIKFVEIESNSGCKIESYERQLDYRYKLHLICVCGKKFSVN